MAFPDWPPKRVFVIGPMGEETDAEGGEVRNHLANIVEAVGDAMEAITRAQARVAPEATLPRVVVSHSPLRTGDIADKVFPRLFHCDLAIADISTRSPNVFYELALLHAVGIPVILLTGDPEQYKVDFYASGSLFETLPSFDVADIRDALLGKTFAARGEGEPGLYAKSLIYSLLFDPKPSDASNPVQKYFGVHLVHLAAATGLATGQYYNFLKYAMKSHGILEKGMVQNGPGAGRKFEKLILVRPDSVSDVNSVTDTLDRVFGFHDSYYDKASDSRKPLYDENGQPVFRLHDVEWKDREHPRKKFFVKRIGHYLIDYPTPLSSLSVSPQMRETFNYLQGVAHEDDEEASREDYFRRAAEAVVPTERKLISIYFDTSRRLVDHELQQLRWDQKILLLPLKEILAMPELQEYRNAES